MQISITAAPLPTNFLGTPQQLIEAFLDRLEVTVEGSSFVIGEVQPSSNQGPWLKNGTQWWVWDEATSTYVPMDLSASLTPQIYIGDISQGPPDSATYQIWLQLNGSEVNGLFYYAGTTAGWVTEAPEFAVAGITVNYLANQNPGSLITFGENGAATILGPGPTGTFLQSNGSTLGWGTPNTVHGVPSFIVPVPMVTGPVITTTTNTSWLTATVAISQVPQNATALILSTVAPNSSAQQWTLSMRASPSGSSYLMMQFGNGISGNGSSPATSAQGIFPFTAAGSNTVTIYYQVVGGTGSVSLPLTITCIGYIS